MLKANILPSVATAIAVAALIIGIVTMNNTSNTAAQSTNLTYKSVTRDFWIFNDKVNEMNDTMVGLPGDHFSISTVVASKGDTINIHFFNVEGKGGDSHSFTIYDKPYDNINVVVQPGTN